MGRHADHPGKPGERAPGRRPRLVAGDRAGQWRGHRHRHLRHALLGPRRCGAASLSILMACARRSLPRRPWSCRRKPDKVAVTVYRDPNGGGEMELGWLDGFALISETRLRRSAGGGERASLRGGGGRADPAERGGQRSGRFGQREEPRRQIAVAGDVARRILGTAGDDCAGHHARPARSPSRMPSSAQLPTGSSSKRRRASKPCAATGETETLLRRTGARRPCRRSPPCRSMCSRRRPIAVR